MKVTWSCFLDYKLWQMQLREINVSNTLSFPHIFLRLVERGVVKIDWKLHNHEWGSLNKKWDLHNFVIFNKFWLLVKSVTKGVLENVLQVFLLVEIQWGLLIWEWDLPMGPAYLVGFIWVASIWWVCLRVLENILLPWVASCH